MRKFAITILIVLMLASSVFAAPAVNVVINGTPVTFTESSGAPFIDNNNRTLVPMRVVMEQYGCTVSWDQQAKTASVTAGDTTVLVPIGQSYITVNGEQRTIDAPAQIVSGRTYLPIRAVLEAFGANVGWDNANKQVVVGGDAEIKSINPDYTNDCEILAKTMQENSEEALNLATTLCRNWYYAELKTGKLLEYHEFLDSGYLDKETVRKLYDAQDVIMIKYLTVKEKWDSIQPPSSEYEGIHGMLEDCFESYKSVVDATVLPTGIYSSKYKNQIETLKIDITYTFDFYEEGLRYFKENH